MRPRIMRSISFRCRHSVLYFLVGAGTAAAGLVHAQQPATALAAPATTQRPASAAMVLDAQANLYQVADNVYRSSQPRLQRQWQLQQLGIRTLINLRFFDPDDDAKTARQLGIRVVNVPLLTWHVRPEQLARAVWEMDQARTRGGVLVHCYHGADRTGLVIAMWRMLRQGWTPEQAREEMLHGPFGYHSMWQRHSNMEHYFTETGLGQVRQALERMPPVSASSR